MECYNLHVANSSPVVKTYVVLKSAIYCYENRYNSLSDITPNLFYHGQTVFGNGIAEKMSLNELNTLLNLQAVFRISIKKIVARDCDFEEVQSLSVGNTRVRLLRDGEPSLTLIVKDRSSSESKQVDYLWCGVMLGEDPELDDNNVLLHVNSNFGTIIHFACF